jgi:hypothetical protein
MRLWHSMVWCCAVLGLVWILCAGDVLGVVWCRAELGWDGVVWGAALRCAVSVLIVCCAHALSCVVLFSAVL